MGHSAGSPEREIHSNTGLHKKDLKISNKQPHPISTRTTGTTPNKAWTDQRDKYNHDQSRIN